MQGVPGAPEVERALPGAAMGCEQCLSEHEVGVSCAGEEGFPGDSEMLAGMGYGPLVFVRKLGTGTLASVYLAQIGRAHV